MLLPAHQVERDDVCPLAAPVAAEHGGRAGAVGVKADDLHVAVSRLVEDLIAHPVLVERGEGAARTIEAGERFGIVGAVCVPRGHVARVRVDRCPIEADPGGEPVLHLVVVQVHGHGAAVRDPAHDLPLRDLLADGQRRHGLQVDVVGPPTVAVIEEHPVLAATVGVGIQHGACRGGDGELAFTEVLLILVALREIDCVLVPVPVCRVSGRPPGLAAGHRHPEERDRPGRPRLGSPEAHRHSDSKDCRKGRTSLMSHRRSPARAPARAIQHWNSEAEPTCSSSEAQPRC